MALIWLYLLGLSNLISGHFAPVEIAMTIIVGAAAIVGIAGFIRFKSSLSPIKAGGIFVLMLAIQLACPPDEFSSGHCAPMNRGSR
jgi:hypothetical protein